MGMTTYTARKAAGLCVGCGGAPQPGRTKCRGCRDAANASRQRVRAETAKSKKRGRKERRCSWCHSAAVATGQDVCEPCAARRWNRCRKCNTGPIPKAKRLCRPCRQKANAAAVRKPPGPKLPRVCKTCRTVTPPRYKHFCDGCRPAKADRDAASRATREKRKAWRAAGLCLRCGGGRTDPASAFCLTCRDQMAEATRRYAKANRVRAAAAREVCRQLGLCWRCRRWAEYGYNVCEKHRRRARP